MDRVAAIEEDFGDQLALRGELMDRVAAIEADFGDQLAGLEAKIAGVEARRLDEARRAQADLSRVRQALFKELSASFASSVKLRLAGSGEFAGTDDSLSHEWRALVRECAGLKPQINDLTEVDSGKIIESELRAEVRFLHENATVAKAVFLALRGKRVLFAGQSYYNCWYLSRGLRALGWKADVLNWDTSPTTQIYYHGEDVGFDPTDPLLGTKMLAHYVASLYAYDVFHFSNSRGISFGWPVHQAVGQEIGEDGEIHLLKSLGKKIAYTNNGCLDGVSQTAFSKWGPESVCAICRWRDEPLVCSDQRNLEWGRFRNSVADYQCTLGGNRVDFNNDPRVHESPEFHCLDSDFWKPNLEIPQQFRLPATRADTVWLYHAVGHRAERTKDNGVNIKSSHVYLPLIAQMKSEGIPVELLEPTGVPNKEVRFLQAQADIFLEMLTYGWFGANAREALMLGKPVICYIRPEWLRSVAEEVPDYASELPIISATPETVGQILRELVASPHKRREIGERGRAFAIKWHSKEAGAIRFDEIYSSLLKGEPLLRVPLKGSGP